MILALLNDPDTIDRVVAAADIVGLSVMLSKAGPRPEEMLHEADEAELVVVELDARGAGGPEACGAIRRASGALLIALGNPQDDALAAAALRSGADCCLPRSVEPQLLAAQMEALLRRRLQPSIRPIRLTVRGLTIDLGTKEVLLRGQPVQLTPTEFRMLEYLANHPGKVVPSSELLRETSGYHCTESEAQEIVKVHISRLRGKIDRDSDSPSYLINVRGFGYLLERRNHPPVLC